MSIVNDKKNLTALLNRKVELMNKLLLITTNAKKITPEVKSAEIYISMQEKRAAIISKLKLIDHDMNLSVYKPLWAGEDKDFLEQLNDTKAQIKEITQKIIVLSNEIDTVAPVIVSEIKKELKGIKKAENINDRYNANVYASSISSGFNISN